MGLFRSDRDLAATKYAGRESATDRARRKTNDRAARKRGPQPTAQQLADAAEQIAATPASAQRRHDHRHGGATTADRHGWTWTGRQR